MNLATLVALSQDDTRESGFKHSKEATLAHKKCLSFCLT